MITDVFFKELQDELRQGTTLKGHPFRYCALATLGLEKMPRLRTIVLRKIDASLNLIFYTDTRSKKVLHIKENNRVSLLFYHPEKLLQIRIEGIATIIKDPNTLKEHRKNIQESSRKDYTTKTAPGSTISSPDAVEYLDDTDYFCMVNIEPFKIEYLKLKRPNHIRVRFSRKDALWESEFLVP